MKIMILGANGMLGNACMNYFLNSSKFEVKGTIRSGISMNLSSDKVKKAIIPDIDILNEDVQKLILSQEKPDVVINCVGLVKQAQDSNNFERSIKINSLLPHQLSNRCSMVGIKLIHVSTDCVFSGAKGFPYCEDDVSDANDLYGRTKFLGEVLYDPNTLTIRTSYIGNELRGANGLLEWFLQQEGECRGYTRAIYSGMPTIILMQAIENILLNSPRISGLYHVASSPISKYNLLKLIAKVFKKKINIIPDDRFSIDRSLDGSRFQDATGFLAPPWEVMIEAMYSDRMINVQR